jgi:hypothetical protein
METDKGRKLKTKFNELPISVKLVVICFLFLGVGSIWRFVSIYIETKSTIELATLIRGIVELGLAGGLVNRSDGSRLWSAFFAFLGSLGALSVLAVLLFQDPNPGNGLQIQTSVPRTEAIIFLSVYFILSVGILFILMRTATKTFFGNQTKQEDK